MVKDAFSPHREPEGRSDRKLVEVGDRKLYLTFRYVDVGKRPYFYVEVEKEAGYEDVKYEIITYGEFFNCTIRS